MAPESLAKVVWYDAHGGDAGWQSIDEFEELHQGAKVVSTGFVMVHDEKGITLAMSRQDDTFSSYVFIPTGNIDKILPLSPMRKKKASVT